MPKKPDRFLGTEFRKLFPVSENTLNLEKSFFWLDPPLRNQININVFSVFLIFQNDDFLAVEFADFPMYQHFRPPHAKAKIFNSSQYRFLPAILRS